MTNYYKYLPLNRDAEKWGLCVLDAGCGRIHKATPYPSRDHPSHHYFNWENGRKLQEYQVIYILNGAGLFESESCPCQEIQEGTIMLLFPEEWHRYKPHENTGWDEYWVGFKGNVIDNLVENTFFRHSEPFLTIGVHEQVVHILNEIIEITKAERPGYQPLVSGIVLHLLGMIHFLSKENYFDEQQNMIESMVNKARIFFRANITQSISMENVAADLGVSYSWFRKTFKTYTGMAPGQYLIQLKIEKAKILLSDPSRSVKEIAYELKFDSCYYFSKLFKEKTGLSPMRYRKKIFS